MIEVKNQQEMMAFGERVGRILQGGEIIELVGDVGAGKTTFVKGIGRGMGIGETVQSPSFTISRQYKTPDGLYLAHYDFYRLKDPGIMSDELTEFIGNSNNVTVIEWSDSIRRILPDDRLTITITARSESERLVKIHVGGEKSKLTAGIIK